jgi:RimJ/RimL family protein N-acetyltransferase
MVRYSYLCVTEAWLHPPLQQNARQILDADFDAFAALIPDALNAPLTRADWDGLTREGYLYFGCFEGERLLSRAGVWQRTQDVWEVIAVRTHGDFLRRGFGAAVVYAAASYVLRHVRVASYTADEGNLASVRTAQAVGFRFCTALVEGEKWCAGERLSATSGARCPLWDAIFTQKA